MAKTESSILPGKIAVILLVSTVLFVLICIYASAVRSTWHPHVEHEHSEIPLPDDNAVAKIALQSNHVDSTIVSFGALSKFYYEIPETGKRSKNQIPDEIKALEGKKVALGGFLIPTDLRNGSTSKFLICRRPGIEPPMPRMNEWISATVSAGTKSVPAVQDRPIIFFGTLHVGEELDHGEVLSIFRMNVDDVVVDPGK